MHGQTHSWTVNHTDRRISARTDEIACVALYYPITLEWHEKKNCIWVMCFVVYWSFELCAPWFTDHLSYVLRGLLIICKNTLRVEQDHTPCIMDLIFSTHPLKIAKFTEMRKSNVLALIWMMWDTLMLKLIAIK